MYEGRNTNKQNSNCIHIENMFTNIALMYYHGDDARSGSCL